MPLPDVAHEVGRGDGDEALVGAFAHEHLVARGLLFEDDVGDAPPGASSSTMMKAVA